MARIQANGIEIEYETFGSSGSPALLLISRLGGQLIDWDAALCESMAANGYFVIRFDNRDSGLSSKIMDPEPGATAQIFKNVMQGKAAAPLYSLEDMAEDAAGLLDALQVESAHICGISMGGMIAQLVAIRHPERARSLISIYSTTGNPDLPGPTDEALKVLFDPPPTMRSANLDHSMNVFRVISGTGIPFDEEAHRKIAGRYYDRSFCPQGTAHHVIAVLLQKNRKAQLAGLALPALVIHGDEDPLVPLAAGQDTAQAIPDAEMVVIQGMGHDLPMMNAHWQRIVKNMVAHMRKTDAL